MFDILLMEEILQTVDRSFLLLFTGFYTSQVVQDFFQQQYFCSLALWLNLGAHRLNTVP